MSFFGLFSDCSASAQPGPAQCRYPDCTNDGVDDEVFVPQSKVVANSRAEVAYVPGGSQYATTVGLPAKHSVFLPPAVQAVHNWDAKQRNSSQPSSRSASVANSPRRTHDGLSGVSTAGTVPNTPELEFRVPLKQREAVYQNKIPEQWPEQDVSELPEYRADRGGSLFGPRSKPHRDCCEGGLPSCLDPDVADERGELREAALSR